MLIKKDEEPFFYKFLSIAIEIIRKNKRYTPVFYGDDEKLYLVCNNYAAVYDFQSNLLLDDELREFGKIPYELSELPNGDLMLTKADHFNCQESYLIAVKNFFKKAGYMSKKIILYLLFSNCVTKLSASEKSDIVTFIFLSEKYSLR